MDYRASGFLLFAILVGCSNPSEDSPPSAAGEDEVVAGARPALAPGKWVSLDRPGEMMMIYGACSPDNFLGEIAKGTLGDDGHTLRAEEGDVCGAYSLDPNLEGDELKVTWKRDPTATAHKDPATVKACKSNEGRFVLMAPAPFSDPNPGNYSGFEDGHPGGLTIALGCATPSTLTSRTGQKIRATIVPKTIDGTPTPFFEAPGACGGYTIIERTPGTVEVNWAHGSDVPLDDAGIARCRGFEGKYLMQ